MAIYSRTDSRKEKKKLILELITNLSVILGMPKAELDKIKLEDLQKLTGFLKK